MNTLTKPGEEEKKPTTDELNKTKVGGDGFDKKPEQPKEEDKKELIRNLIENIPKSILIKYFNI